MFSSVKVVNRWEQGFLRSKTGELWTRGGRGSDRGPVYSMELYPQIPGQTKLISSFFLMIVVGRYAKHWKRTLCLDLKLHPWIGVMGVEKCSQSTRNTLVMARDADVNKLKRGRTCIWLGISSLVSPSFCARSNTRSYRAVRAFISSVTLANATLLKQPVSKRWVLKKSKSLMAAHLRSYLHMNWCK